MKMEHHRYSLKLARPLRGLDQRQGILISLHGADGCVGWGEAAPFPGLSSESLDQAEAALQNWADDPAGLQACPSAMHAVGTALLDLEGQRSGLPLCQLLAPMPSRTVPVSHLVSNPAMAAAAIAAGASCLKMKLGQLDLDKDLGRLAAVRLAVGEDITLRVDINRLWSLETAKAAMPDLETLGVDLIEEATENPDDMRRLRGSSLKLAADESVRSPAQLQSIIECGWIDAVVLKPMLIGSPQTTIQMARTAAGAGLSVIITTTIDSWVARRTALHIAAAVPEDYRLAAGLMTGAWLADPMALDPDVSEGHVEVPTGPGLDLGDWRAP
jgi:o-succinylbenzoate synthase